MTENKRLKVESPDTVDASVLETIEYQYQTKRDIDIRIEQPEFTSVCPMTGLPDFGAITINYCPDKKIVELKALKYYFLQYRNVGIFYEHVVNRILEDLVEALQPKRLEVVGNFTPRGGISTQVSAQYIK
ncbi:MAG: NADPH-dependent 7-cyano-7-deazaguanine reductase QueF [Desulfatibacillum sp.]|nr:NADPH-dependent 7-cyano-7-deazaguanine reductase QueF [Desulfatibacillum sp.]